MIFVVKALMTLATLCYAVGYASRRRDNRLHRSMMMVGFLLTLTAGAGWATGVLVFGESLRPAYWLIRATGAPERAHWVVVAHRILAGVTLVSLSVQVATGLQRDPLHSRLYPYTIALWLMMYVSGMFLFA